MWYVLNFISFLPLFLLVLIPLNFVIQEALPPTATHETVRQQFKQFGNVVYVSLPKYRTSGRIKEFGFVEFEEKSSVAKCISAFRQFDGVIGDAHEPENLKSVVAYMKEQDELEKGGESQKSQTEKNKDATEEETTVEPSVEIPKTTEDGVNNSNDIEKETVTEIQSESKVEEGGEVKQKEEKTKLNDDQLQKNSKRVNEEPLNDTENPPAKRLKTQESEEQQDIDDQGNTTDEKASVTDENQDQKTQK